MEKAVFNWSGGKDSALALYKILKKKEYDVCSLLTSVSEKNNRISMHGIRTSLLEKQAESIGIPLTKLMLAESSSMELYEDKLEKCLFELIKKTAYTHLIYGDIFLEDIRSYREKQLGKLNLKAVFPLWKKNTKNLIHKFIELGFKSVIVCVDERYLDSSFLGRIIDDNFINALPENVDPCGENGEYHSFVFDGPIFSFPLNFTIGEKVFKKYKSHSNDDNSKDAENGFWFCDLLT